MADNHVLEAAAVGLFATRYLSVAGLTVLIWDHCLTFDREKQLIWPSRSIFVKWLFLSTRYMIPLVLSLEAYTMSGIGSSTLSNKIWFVISFMLGATSLLAANFLVLLKLWKLWDGKRFVLLSSIFAFVGTGVATIVIASLLVKETISLILLNSVLRMCIGTQKPRLLKFGWGLNCIFDLFVLSMVLWNALSRPREHRTVLANVLYRDGILIFLSISAMGWMNFLLAALATPSKSLLGIFCNWALTFTIVFRMLMNVREAELLASQEPKDDTMSLNGFVDVELQADVPRSESDMYSD